VTAAGAGDKLSFEHNIKPFFLGSAANG